jgi:predicted RecB family nuclease
METIIRNKIDLIFSQLVKTKYLNPFVNQNVLKIAKQIGIDLIPKSMGFNGCSPLGFFGNRMCEIVVSDKKNVDDIEISEEEKIHLKLLIQNWNLCPYILFVSNTGKIISLNQYNKTKKRKRDFEVSTDSEVSTNPQIPDNTWITASSTRNYMLDDPIIDFLKERTVKRQRSSSEGSDTFLSRVFDNGNKFEQKIVERIKLLVPAKDFVEIAKSYEARSLQKYNLTIKAINSGIPIIYQPVLWNHTNKTFGCADLLIRSDYAVKLFPSYPSSNAEPVYEVYDIKWSSIKLRASSDYMVNEISVKPYKAQIWIYTDALNKIQENQSTRGFVIGKNYIRERSVNKVLLTENYLDPFEKLGIIDFSSQVEQENIEKTVEAIEWLKEIKTNNNLCVDPPNDPRLYPNMKNTFDSEYHTVKKDLANKNKEITLLYSVGKRSRDLALSQGIERWDDPNINSAVLGINQKSKLASLIDGIIDINKLDNQENITYAKLSNFGNWKTSKVKCYVDIETIGKTVYSLDIERSNFIFMIGLGVQIGSKWEFNVFTAKTLDSGEEQRIIKEFNLCMNQIQEKYSSSKLIPVFHWSNYENTNLRPYVNISDKFEFFDMCKWFKDDEICVKGAFDFKLKSVTRALHKAGLTEISWDDSVSGGLDAMNQAYIYYKSNLTDKKIIQDIEYYNQIDCRSMAEIHNILQLLL